MKELNKTTRLAIAAALLCMIIVVGLLGMRKPAVSYKVSPEEAVMLLKDNSKFLSRDQLQAMRSSNNPDITVIDIRNDDEYSKGHLEHAINIPLRKLFDRKIIRELKKHSKSGGKLILYGEETGHAAGVWFLLSQAGLGNLYILKGGYPGFNDRIEASRVDTLLVKQLTEEPQATGKANSPAAQEKKQSIPLKKKAPTSGGGC